jgi:hypothetical protein
MAVLFRDANDPAFPGVSIGKKKLISLANDRAIMFWFILAEPDLIVSWINNRKGSRHGTTDGNISSELHFLSVQYGVNNGGKSWGVYDLRCGDMYLDVEVGRVGFVFCLQGGGAEQHAEYGNELFHFTFPQELKPT